MRPSTRKPAFPVEGTTFEEPGPNAEAILHYLIATILDILPAEGIEDKYSQLVVSAATMERECLLGRYPCVDLNGRDDAVIWMIDDLILLYNHMARDVPGATSITIVEGHPRGRNLYFTKDVRHTP